MAAALPRTLGELQLYRILQRANLLCYYETFIQQGGDDVQQLCEAGEDEFLEIMALVGMASKPLHVRRLQKALRDWVTNPALFSQPRTTPVCSVPVYKMLERAAGDPDAGADGEVAPASPRLWIGRSADSEPSLSPAEPGTPASPLEVLDVAAVRSVAECVTRLVQAMPRIEAAEVRDLMKANKKMAKTIGHIFDMSTEDPHREEEIRKYSAIYGRFDSKRRDGKQLTLHELTVNEAAAQLCMRNMALLTRRDELFGLARQVSREVTYKYTYQNSRSQCGDRDELSPKRIKTEEVVSELFETEQPMCPQLETPKERLTPAAPGDTDTAGHSVLPSALTACLPSPLTQAQLERLLTKQMEVLHNASGREKVQALSWMFPPGPQKEHLQKRSPNGLSTNKPEQEAEQPLALRTSGPRRSLAEGELPLGRQLASELKRRHSMCAGRMQITENGSRMDSLKAVLNLTNKKSIKLEPEDST